MRQFFASCGGVDRGFVLKLAASGLTVSMLAGCALLSPKASNPPPMVYSTTKPSPAVAAVQPGIVSPGGQPTAADLRLSEFTSSRVSPEARSAAAAVLAEDVGAPVVGAALVQHTVVTEGADSDVAADPSGQWLVFASTRHSPRSKLYLQRADGSAVVQLTSDAADDAHPTFSPDGKSVAFASNRSGVWKLYLTDLSGTTTTQLTQGGSQDIHPSFSPDGKWLAYNSQNPMTGQWEIWLMSVETGQRRFITTGLQPVFSPQTSVARLVFQKARQRGSRWYSIWTIDLVDGDGRNPTEVAVSADAALVSPAWSPDGQSIVFSAIKEPARVADPLSPALAPASQNLWIIDADGTNRRQLTGDSSAAISPFWASNNRVYFVSDRAGHDSIWSVMPTASVSALAGPAGESKSQPTAAAAPRPAGSGTGANRGSPADAGKAAVTSTADTAP